MLLVPLTVSNYSGYKADEYPIRYIWCGKTVHIKRILDRWYQSGGDSAVHPAEYFRIMGTDECVLLLKHEMGIDRWFAVIGDLD